jgi:hypothetical protein
MLDFYGHLDFDKRSARESGNSDGGPDVATGRHQKSGNVED